MQWNRRCTEKHSTGRDPHRRLTDRVGEGGSCCEPTLFFRLLCVIFLSFSFILKCDGGREYRIHSEGRTCRDSRLSWVKNRFFLDDRLFSLALSTDRSVSLRLFPPSLLVQLCCDLGLNTNQLSSLMDSEYNKKKEGNDWPSTPYNFYLGFWQTTLESFNFLLFNWIIQ